jgi:hypothetical protein
MRWKHPRARRVPLGMRAILPTVRGLSLTRVCLAECEISLLAKSHSDRREISNLENRAEPADDGAGVSCAFSAGTAVILFGRRVSYLLKPQRDGLLNRRNPGRGDAMHLVFSFSLVKTGVSSRSAPFCRQTIRVSFTLPAPYHQALTVISLARVQIDRTPADRIPFGQTASRGSPDRRMNYES